METAPKKKLLKSKFVNDILTDENGKYSRTSVSWVFSFAAFFVMACVDFYYNGLRYDVWVALGGLGAVMKVTNTVQNTTQNVAKTKNTPIV